MIAMQDADTLPACLAGNGLPLRWRGQPRFVILDTDFGHGEQFLATWRAWQADPDRPLRLHYLAIGANPPACAGMPLALQADWPLAVAGFQRILLDQGGVTLDLMVGEPAACLAQTDARLDAVYLGVTPCPARALARLAQRSTTLTARSLSAVQRESLSAAGFVCTIDADPVRAVFAGRKPPPVPSLQYERRAIVIGAGLAGAAACERLSARGWHVTLVERHAQPAQEASGNLAGIFMPQLSQDDNPATRLSRAAYLFALRHWQGLGGIGTAFAGARCGVLQLARDAAHAGVQSRIAAGANYPPQFARWLDAAAASALLGAAAPDGGWLFGQGGWAHPAAVCGAMLDACGGRLVRLFSSSALKLIRVQGEWQVCGPDGAILAQAPTVILANGTGATALAQAAGLPLSPVRGQVTHLAAGSLPALPLVVCREAYLTPASNGIVCVGATYDADGDRALRIDSQQENLKKIASILGQGVLQAPLAGRTGFRCVAPDRLPLVGALPDPAIAGAFERLRDVPRWPGLYGLLGYASRGLIWAPLAAELLAAQLNGEPLPVESGLAAALDPARFLLRERRRSHR